MGVAYESKHYPKKRPDPTNFKHLELNSVKKRGKETRNKQRANWQERLKNSGGGKGVRVLFN